MTKEAILPFISICSTIIPLCIGLFRFQKLDRSLQILLGGVSMHFIGDFTGAILLFTGINNAFFYNIYIFFSNAVWWYCFYYVLREDSNYRKILIWMILITNVLLVYSVLQVNFFKESSGLAFGIVSGHIMFNCLLYLVFLAFTSEELRIDRHPFFIISSGLLMYNAIVVSIYASLNFLPRIDLFFLYNIKSISYIFLNLLFAYVFLKYPQPTIVEK